MAERTSYLPGTPSWVDIGVPDIAVATAFYGGLFGWTVDVDPRPDAGGYAMATLRDLAVAGFGPQMMADVPPFWSVYVTVADVAASVAAAADHGATVVMPTMEVLDAGHMAIVQDPCGSSISMWQPLSHIGCGLATTS